VVGRHTDSEAFFRQAIETYAARGDRSATARATAGRASTLLDSCRAHGAVAFLEPQMGQFADIPEDPGVIAFNGVLARAYFLLEDYRRSQQIAEKVLDAAERLEQLPIIADTLVTRSQGHPQPARMYQGV